MEKKVIQAIPDSIFLLNTAGLIVDYREPATGLLFLPKEEVRNRHFSALLPAARHDEAGSAFDKACTGKTTVTIRFQSPVPGTGRYFEGRFSPYQDNSGVLFIVRDISPQMETEQKLQSLSTLHQLIVEFSSRLIQSGMDEIDAGIDFTLKILGDYAHVDRVYIFDYVAETDLLYNTYEWCAEGIPPEISNLQGIPFSLVPRWKQKFSRQEHVYIPLVAEIDPQYNAEKEILDPQGIQSLLALPMFSGVSFIGFIGFDAVRHTREWSEEHINLLRLAGQIIAGTIYRGKYEKEITEARKMAEKANKAKSEFLASISHEIRTPMNAILGFSEILYNNTTNPKDKNFLSGILSSGRTLLYLINDILDLSKIEAGQMEIITEPTRLSDLLDDIGRIFSAKVLEKSLDFRISITEGVPDVLRVDDVRLRQVLFNLVGNAVKFTHSGAIELKASCTPNPRKPNLCDLEIAVIDTGIGIPASYQHIIFDAFVQVDMENNRKYGGTGLGLAITQRLVQMMNGTLSLESQVDKGSTFTIHLHNIEITSETAERTNLYEWFDKVVTFEPATILVVDDVAFNRELAKSFLGMFNFTVLEAKNGNEGVTVARLYKPDLILMDLRMPQMTGYQAVEILKKFPETKEITCIAFTASSMRHDEELIHSLFDGFLMKPITRNELIDCLMKWLPHHVSEPQPGSEAAKESEPACHDLPVVHDPKLEQLKEEITARILPDLKKLLIYLDSDVFDNLMANMLDVCQRYNIYHFEQVLALLKAASENYDFEMFTREIHNLDLLVNQLLKK